MNFILDGMLGRLARWLRMIGHDVIYSTNLTDFELIAMAKKESRVLLTRDLALYKEAVSKGLDAYYTEGLTETERLADLALRFGVQLEIDLEKSRCPRCNGKIFQVQKESIAGKVEQNTFIYYDAFWQCHSCGQVYWQGAHWKKICAILHEAEEKRKNRLISSPSAI